MSKPKAPTPPDPAKTAQAQTQQSIDTAIANNTMGMVNQRTPDGSLSYNIIGYMTDPSTGRQIPRYEAVTELSTDAQKLRDASNAANLNLSNLAVSQSGRLEGLLSKPMDLSSIPGMADRSLLQPSQYGGDINGPQFEDVGNLPQYDQFSGGPSYGRVGNGGGYQDVGGSLQSERMGSGQGYAELGSGPSYERAGSGPSYGRVNNAEQYADIGSGPFYARQTGNAGLTDRYDVGDATRYEQALMERMNPQLDRSRQQLETNLANRGIKLGSAAYDRALDESNRASNDARIAAILNAGQEQSRIAGLNRDQAVFGNSARQQTFDNANNQIGYNNQVSGLERADQFNAANFNNANSSRRISDALATTGFNNSVMGAERSDQLNAINQNNDATGRERADQVNTATFNNSVAGQRNADQFQRTAYNNTLSSADRADQFATADFANQNRARSIADALAGTGFNNNASAMEYANQVQRTGLNNDLRSQDLANRTNAASFNNANRSQTYANQQAVQARNDNNANNRYAQIMNMLDAQDRQRAQAMQEQFAIRNQPINEIGALLSGSQVATPNFGIAQPDRMATTDIASLTNQGYQNQLAAYQSKMAGLNNTVGALSGLGSAFLLGPAGGLFGLGAQAN